MAEASLEHAFTAHNLPSHDTGVARKVNEDGVEGRFQRHNSVRVALAGIYRKRTIIVQL